MTKSADEIRTVVVERDFPHPPEKVWRALTLPHLLADWLMTNNFKPELGHHFELTGNWGGVLRCEVLAVEPNERISYTWNFDNPDPAFALRSVVTFTLIPIANGTHLRMEQSGFKQGQKQAYGGARMGWARYLANLDELLCQMD